LRRATSLYEAAMTARLGDLAGALVQIQTISQELVAAMQRALEGSTSDRSGLTDRPAAGVA